MSTATSRVVTIDGPAGTGKSTVASNLAQRLCWMLLDTGAMYRGVALTALQQGIPLHEAGAVSDLVHRVHFTQEDHVFFLNGQDVTADLRTPQVSLAASQVAAIPAVRQRLVEWQRRAASQRDTVAEGRDQGTVVFPDALAKFFLTASAETRARRRFDELVAKGMTVPFDEVLRDQAERDCRDAGRDVAPMTPAYDSLIVDTSALTIDEVSVVLESHVRAALGEIAAARADRLWRARMPHDRRVCLIAGSLASLEAAAQSYLGGASLSIEPPQGADFSP